MLRFLRWLGIGLAVILMLIALFAVERYHTLKSSLADLSGEHSLPGLSGPVTIVRDRHGVPHIQARTLDDALTGLGFVHAQDRLWQMTFLRRSGQGRLSELAGSFAVEADKNLRAVGLARLAAQSYDLLSPEAQSALKAYARGVNAVIEDVHGTDGKPLPPEFFLTQSRPEPWTAQDSLLMMNLIGMGLSGNAGSELKRLALAAQLGPEKLAEFMAPAPGLPDTVDPDLLALAVPDPVPGNQLATAMFDTRPASNNWVVDGRWTTHGGALLANDPHLGLTMPGVWYLAHLNFGGRHAIGSTMPGIPSILLGRTNDVSWGFTTTNADVQDLVLERFDAQDPTRYLTPSGTRAIETRTEEIKVRFGSPVTVEIQSTRHGPLLPLLQTNAPEGHAYAIQWTALDPDNRSYETSLNILKAGNLDEALDALRDYASPVQTIVLADRFGDVGLIAAGKIPVRAPETGHDGSVPIAGWKHERIWSGMLALEDLPQFIRPESGYALSANGDMRPPDYPHHITYDWKLPLRHERVEALVSGQRGHDADRFAAMMMDNRTGLIDRLVPSLLAATSKTDETAEALDLMAAWDGEMSMEAPEPLILVAWLDALMPRIVADELGDEADGNRGLNPVLLANALEDVGGQAHWCDDITTDAPETCAAQTAAALGEALDRLEAAFGADRTAWRWGTAHQAQHNHLPFGFIPVLRDWFSRSNETAGGDYTVNRGSYRIGARNPFGNVHSAGYRAVYDMKEPQNSLYMISTGQSGNPYSDLYDNMMERWAAGETLEMSTDPAVFERDALGTIRINP